MLFRWLTLRADLKRAEAELALANRKLVFYMEKSARLEAGYAARGKKLARLAGEAA